MLLGLLIQNLLTLRLIVLGTAGTGKLVLINMIKDGLNEIAGDHNVDVSLMMLLILTSVAAFNVHGATIHLIFSIPIFSKTFDLSGENLKRLQGKLDGVYYFIIDKKSMVRGLMLALIDLCLHQAFPMCRNQVFGGQSMILVRDFGQLPPVLNKLMYSQVSQGDFLSNDAIAIYRQFRKVYRLAIVQHQLGNSDE